MRQSIRRVRPASTAAAYAGSAATLRRSCGSTRRSKSTSVYRELRERGRAREALAPLLASDDPDVRLWVGAHALEFDPPAGEAVLRGLARDDEADPATRVSAETTLRLMRKQTPADPYGGMVVACGRTPLVSDKVRR